MARQNIAFPPFLETATPIIVPTPWMNKSLSSRTHNHLAILGFVHLATFATLLVVFTLTAPQIHSLFVPSASKQRLPRPKKEKAANPRRGSRALEAREEIEKDEDVKDTQPEITEKETEQLQTERQTKEESEPKVPEARTVSSKAAEQPSAMGSVEQTTPRVADGELLMRAMFGEDIIRNTALNLCTSVLHAHHCYTTVGASVSTRSV